MISKQEFHKIDLQKYIRDKYFHSKWRGRLNAYEDSKVYVGILFIERMIRDIGYYEMDNIEAVITNKTLKITIKL